MLSVYSATPRAWRTDETQALAALAAMASAALANAELYRSVAEEKERSEAILGNIADGIVAVDRDGTIVLWNATAAQITGVPASEAVGRRVAETLQRELESGDERPAGEREVAILRGGDEVWLSLTEAVMHDDSGAVAGRVFAFRDVSAERAVETMKSEFVAAVSHELRTPLTSIYGFAETLMRQDVQFEETDRATFLGYIASESERLIRIVDDLLNVARLEAGTLGLDLGPVDLGEVVAGVVKSEPKTGHRFDVDVPAGLVALADRGRLGEVVHHLVANAIKLSPPGGTITIAGPRALRHGRAAGRRRGGGNRARRPQAALHEALPRRRRRAGPGGRNGRRPLPRPRSRGRDARPPLGRVGGEGLELRVRAARFEPGCVG